MSRFSHDDHAREVTQLQAESELPIHELLQMYGINSKCQEQDQKPIYSAAPYVAQCREESADDTRKSSNVLEAFALAELLALEARLLKNHENVKWKTQPSIPLPRFPEPKSNKTHWSHALEEMSWLAGDFARERIMRYVINALKKARSIATYVLKGSERLLSAHRCSQKIGLFQPVQCRSSL